METGGKYGASPAKGGYGKSLDGGKPARYGAGDMKNPSKKLWWEVWRGARPDLDPSRRFQMQGPFMVQGHRATDIEYRVYTALMRLGWSDENVQFQFSLMGGRMMPGGVSLDFVVWSPGMPVIIEPSGEHWHTATQEQLDKDKARYAKIRNVWDGPFRYVSIGGGELLTDEMAMDRLLREVGRA